MNEYIAEFVGTCILMLLGNAVVCNVLLTKTKGNGSGWLAICAGWGFAVFVAVLCVQQYSGAHINPAVTLGVALAGDFAWVKVPGFMAAQMLGAIVGASIVYVFYSQHFAITKDADAKLGTFCTAPAIRSVPINLFCEVVATFVLVFAVLLMADPYVQFEGGDNRLVGLGSVGAIPVGLIVFAIGISLGGTTGYAINPARDLGPRIAHAILPIPGKRDSDWSYAAIPVVGPLAGGALAAAIHIAIVQ